MIKVATIQEAVDLIHANAVPKGETVYVVAPQSEEGDGADTDRRDG